MSQIVNIQNVTTHTLTFSDIPQLEFFVLAENDSYDTCQRISTGSSNNVINQKKKEIITVAATAKVMRISQLTIAVEKL